MVNGLNIDSMARYWSQDAENYGNIIADELASFRVEAWQNGGNRNVCENMAMRSNAQWILPNHSIPWSFRLVEPSGLIGMWSCYAAWALGKCMQNLI